MISRTGRYAIVGSAVFVAAVIIGAALVYVLEGLRTNRETESVLQNRLASAGLLSVMVERAETALRGNPLTFTVDEERRLHDAEVSWWKVIQPDPACPSEVVVFALGGADDHYGIAVIRGSVPPAYLGKRLTHLQGNVWYWSENR